MATSFGNDTLSNLKEPHLCSSYLYIKFFNFVRMSVSKPAQDFLSEQVIDLCMFFIKQKYQLEGRHLNKPFSFIEFLFCFCFIVYRCNGLPSDV